MITFVIFTYNEERRIERVIKNYQGYGRVLLADDGSTDRTLEIAKSLHCDVVLRPKNDFVFVENSIVMKAIYEAVKTEWIFLGYADEMIDKVSLDEISNLIKQDNHDIIKITRKNYFYGEFCHKSYQSANNRFFKVGAIDFDNNFIHGFGHPKSDKIYQLPERYFIHQFIDYTATSYLNSINKYTESELNFEYQSRKSIWHLLFRLAKNLLKNYFFEGGYKAGFAGLSLTELTIFYELVKNIKFYEQENNLTKLNIEKKNDIIRDNILNNLN